MKFTGDYLYRVRVIAFPAGSHEVAEWDEDTLIPVVGWRPPGWRPEGNYTAIMGTSEFVWPVTNRVYGSHSTASKRAHLLNSFGATAVVERSSRITWPVLAEAVAS